MPALRIDMRKIKDALRLKFESNQSHQQIATALGISKGVVTKYVGLAVAAGLDAQSVAAMDEASLSGACWPITGPVTPSAQVDYGRILPGARTQGHDPPLLWEEYSAQVGCEYNPQLPVKARSYSQFPRELPPLCQAPQAPMRQVHRAGEKLFIDFAGPTVALTVQGKEAGRATFWWLPWAYLASATAQPHLRKQLATGWVRPHRLCSSMVACPSSSCRTTPVRW